jgi:hypothetical protein
MDKPGERLFRVECKVVLYVLAEGSSVAKAIGESHLHEESPAITVEPATAEGLRTDHWSHTNPYAARRASEPCYRYLEKA